MQVRQLLIASLLAIGAAGAMSQEIDRGETLQAKSLASRQDRAESSVAATRATVVAQSRDAQALSQTTAGERANGGPAAAAPNISWAKWHVSRPYGKSWLHGDRRQVPTLVVAEHG
jgi:hypothetical protein